MRLPIVCILALASASCGPQRSASNILHVFNWADYIGKDTIPTFEAATGVRVVYDNYSSNEDLLAKLQSGGSGYDVIFPSGYMVEILKQKGLLAKIDRNRIPNLRNVMPQFARSEFDPAGDLSVPYTWSTTGIGFLIGDVPESMAGSWKVLFDERYRGRILMLDDMRATIGMALKSMGYSANSVDPEEIRRAKERLVAQKKLVHVYASSNIPDLFASREVSLGYAWSGDILQAKARNPKVQYMIPSEGTLMYVDYMCIPAAAPNKELAHRFINHVLDPGTSAEIANTIRYATANTVARSHVRPELKELWGILEKYDLKRFEYIKNLGAKIRLYDEAWQGIKNATK